jgi:hypothetical protein
VPDWIVKLLNRVNDWDLTWVGFRAFRPALDQDMTARVVLALSLVYCPLSAGMAFLITWLSVRVIVPRHSVHADYPAHLPWVMAVSAPLAFILLQSLLACAWNRRAVQLRADARRTTPTA